MRTISEQALIKRINRRLDAYEQLHKARSERESLDLGDFFVIDHNRNIHIAQFVDLNKLAEELGIDARC